MEAEDAHRWSENAALFSLGNALPNGLADFMIKHLVSFTTNSESIRDFGREEEIQENQS